MGPIGLSLADDDIMGGAGGDGSKSAVLNQISDGLGSPVMGRRTSGMSPGDSTSADLLYE